MRITMAATLAYDDNVTIFRRKMWCRDYHNGRHAVLTCLRDCIPISS